jgi:hypothetical protein
LSVRDAPLNTGENLVRVFTLTFDPDKATSAKLTQATTDAGFPSKVISKP